MSTFSKHLFAAMMGAAILSSCSRPVAYFQRGPVENYHAPKTETVAAVTPVEATEPTVTVTPAESAASIAVAPPVTTVATAMTEIEAYVRNDSKLATDKKVNKRMDRVKRLLATTNAPAVAPNATAPAKKLTLMERTVLKKMDKKINRTLAPEKTQAASNTRLGAIIGVVGLLLILVGAIASSGAVVLIGLLGLIVGLVLLLIGLASNA